MQTRAAAILLLATLAHAQTTSHPDTVVVDNCVNAKPGAQKQDILNKHLEKVCHRLFASRDAAISV